MTTITHGVNFTVSITNTLSGASFLWDDCEGSKGTGAGHGPLAIWEYCWHSGSGTEENSAWSENYRKTNDADLPSSTGPALPHTRGTQYICGAAQTDGSLGPIYASEVMFEKTFTRPAYPYYLNMNWWEHADSRYVHGIGSPTDNNWKWSGLTASPYNPTPGPNWYLNAQVGPNGFVDNTSDVNAGANDDSASNAFFGYSNGAGPNPAATWIYRQIKVRLDNGAGGYCKGFVNKPANTPVQDLSVSGVTDNYAGTTRGVYVGGYNRNYPNSNNWRYWKDICLDVQATDDGELVLTNNATYLSATIFAHQPRVSVTGSTSTHKCNGGALADGTVHMHWRSEVNGNSYLGTATLGVGPTSYTLRAAQLR